jgi:acetyl esterase/lipase
MLGVRSGGEHNRAAVQAVCDWAGPVDLVEIIDDSPADLRTVTADMMWRLFLGLASDNKKLRESYSRIKRQQLLQSGSPLAFLKDKAPPFLVVHGDQDKIVPVVQSRRFVKRLQDLESNVEYIELPGVGHNPGERPISQQRALAFFREHLGLSGKPRREP